MTSLWRSETIIPTKIFSVLYLPQPSPLKWAPMFRLRNIMWDRSLMFDDYCTRLRIGRERSWKCREGQRDRGTKAQRHREETISFRLFTLCLCTSVPLSLPQRNIGTSSFIEILY